MAHPDHTRDTDARSPRRPIVVAAPLAVVATASAVTLGVLLQGAGQPAADTAASSASSASSRSAAATVELPVDGATGATSDTSDTVGERAPILSRSQARALGPEQTVEKPRLTSEFATRKAIRAAKQDGKQLFVTDNLNLWTKPGEKADNEGELEAGRQVLVTGRSMWGRTEVVVEGRARWVSEGYLSKDEPVAVASGPSAAACPDGSVESGLADSAVLVWRSVCRAFPQIYDVGGYAPRGEHSGGKALDLMIADVSAGTDLAEFLRANAAALNLYTVIYRQRIFTQERAGEGWRGMPDRGSATANHMDHVHVATY